MPDLRTYAPVLWRYWEENLDRDRARRPRPGGKLAGRRVVITGASSGIGRATALQIAQHGGVPILVARRADALEELRKEIERAGGQAWVYACDITEEESVDTLVKQLLTDHEGIDMLVNNAGRSIRRSIKLSYDRFHDFERTMALNYFGAIRLILGLLPHMTERRFGHIVNVSSIGVQTNPPRFSAYVASKAALDAFSRVVATETFGDGVTFTNIHMPLVRTPMIGPTSLYDAFPTKSPEEAADMLIDALVNRPKTIDTRLGTFGEVLHAVAPKLADEVLHVAYRVLPRLRRREGAGHRGGRAVDGLACGRRARRGSSPACTGSDRRRTTLRSPGDAGRRVVRESRAGFGERRRARGRGARRWPTAVSRSCRSTAWTRSRRSAPSRSTPRPPRSTRSVPRSNRSTACSMAAPGVRGRSRRRGEERARLAGRLRVALPPPRRGAERRDHRRRVRDRAAGADGQLAGRAGRGDALRIDVAPHQAGRGRRVHRSGDGRGDRGVGRRPSSTRTASRPRRGWRGSRRSSPRSGSTSPASAISPEPTRSVGHDAAR